MKISFPNNNVLASPFKMIHILNTAHIQWEMCCCRPVTYYYHMVSQVNDDQYSKFRNQHENYSVYQDFRLNCLHCWKLPIDLNIFHWKFTLKMWKCENVQRKFNRGKNLLTHYSTHSFDSSASMNEVWRLWKLRKKSFHFPWLFRSANQTLSFSTFQLMKNWISMENQQWFSQIYSHLWTPRKAQNHGTQQTDFSELH